MSEASPAAQRTEALSAPYVLEYPYHRSTGPIIGRFLAGLRDRTILGIRGMDGRVIVPPQEYDPETGDTLTDMLEVGQSGVVVSWSWIEHPRAKHLIQEPFAFALIKLDGADTSMLHAVAAPAEAAMRTGMRVRAQWRDETVGAIGDIVCFVPEDAR